MVSRAWIYGVRTSAASEWPNATNTGITVSTSALTIVNTNLFSSAAGQVIQNLDVRGTIIIQTTGVTVKNCKAVAIEDSGSWDSNGNSAGAGMTVQDCEISPDSASGGPNTAISVWGGHGATFQRCNLHTFENGFWIEANNCVVRDNWLHDPIPYTNPPDPHIDGLQVPNDNPSPVTNLQILHNNFDFVDDDISSCCTIGACPSITIDSNRFIASLVAVYLNGGTAGSFTNNDFVAPASYPADVDTSGAGSITFSGNYNGT